MVGVQSAVKVGAVAGAAVLLAHRFWPAFNKGLGLSGKLACVMIPFLGAFALQGEHHILRRSRQENRKMNK